MNADGNTSDGHVTILLATYDGETYLDEQLTSLFRQSYSDFSVVIRDDGSTDGTQDILGRWASAHPDRIKLMSDDLGNLGYVGNFSRLMAACDAPYFALCDQDDVWLPNKIELLMNEMRWLESNVAADVPILVHSDVRLVDSSLREIGPSYLRHMQIDPRIGGRLDHLIVKNIVTGCAMLGNRALLNLALPIPAETIYHDWWVAIVAASCGIMKTVAEPTVLYRQHGKNQVGIGEFRPRNLWGARHILQQPKKLKKRVAWVIALVQPQAQMLLDSLGNRMPRRNRRFLQAFCLPWRRGGADALPWLQRMLLALRCLYIYARLSPYIVLHWCY